MEKSLTLHVLDFVIENDSEDDEFDRDKFDESDNGEELDYQAVWEPLTCALPR